jgi:diguanylate cyclase (GGDEF)-like protein/PAS domain S-box-containing protein
MDTYTTVNIITSLVVLCAVFIMFAAILAGQKMKRHVPDGLLGRWRFMTKLMQFFLAGYILFFIILVSRFSIRTELITAPVFLGGAVFVLIVIKLTRDTIRKVGEAEENLRLFNESLERRVGDRTRDLFLLGESLERRVGDRTRDLEQSRKFLQNVLDSLHEEVMIIDVDTFKIVRANSAFLARHGVQGTAIIGKTCHEITHNRQDVCAAPEDICPLLETVKTGGHAMAEHIHVDARGNKRYVEVSSSPIRDAGGRIARIVHVTRDITERRIAEESVRESEERYRRLIEMSPDGISLHVDGKFVFVNPAGMRLLGATHADQLIGMSGLDVVHPDYTEIEKRRMQQLENNTDMVSWTEEKYVALDGAVIDVEVAGVRFSYQGKPAVQTIFRDIAERKLAAQRIEHLALHDPLTGLPNRLLFFDRIHQVIAEAKRDRNIFALLYIDMDDFKPINDTYGHNAGDRLLREVSKRLTSSMRESDPIARIGGDEFIGICRTITTPEEAELVARKIIANQAEPFDLKGHSCSIGVSIGISIYPLDGDDAGTLLNRADEAMYRVKKSGKGGYLRYSKR